MGKFIKDNFIKTTNSLVDGFNDRLKNPYYLHQNKSHTVVTYYRQNITASSLDEALKIKEAYVGSDSPTRFNKINDFLIYGIDKISAELEDSDFGLTTSSINGSNAIILPNTIIPIPGDYFSINHSSVDYLFEVTSVTQDTFENGANYFSIEWKYSKSDSSSLSDLIIKNFNLITNNIGTDFRAVIEESEKDYILVLEELLLKTKEMFIGYFYNDKVQTFTVMTDDELLVYDTYLIQFILNTGIFNNSDVYVTHQLAVNAAMLISYDSTFFRTIENKIKDNMNLTMIGRLEEINQVTSIFENRQEYYNQVVYIADSYGSEEDAELVSNSPQYIQVFEDTLVDAINDSTITDDASINNIIVRYFDSEILTGDDLLIFDSLASESRMTLFYMLPILIFILEKTIKDVMKGVIKIPRVDLGVAPTTVKYNVDVISSFSDSVYTYYVGKFTITDDNIVYIVNRYNADNEIATAFTTTEPTEIYDCQVLAFT